MKTKTFFTAFLAVAIVFAIAAGTVGFQGAPTAFADNKPGNGPPHGCDASSQGFKSSHECKHPPG